MMSLCTELVGLSDLEIVWPITLLGEKLLWILSFLLSLPH